MKKILAISLLIAFCTLAICSCVGTPDMSSVNKITYGERFYSAENYDEDLSNHPYIIIYDDGFMDRVTSSRTIRYKYEIVDESTLAYFYFDSTGVNTDTNKHGIFAFSENVLLDKDGTVYVREGYVNEELPSFGK